MSRNQTLIDLFVRHKVAPNLVMLMMILSGLWAVSQINLQLDPSVDSPVVTVRAAWPGATTAPSASPMSTWGPSSPPWSGRAAPGTPWWW